MLQRKLKEHMETHPTTSLTNPLHGNSNPNLTKCTYCQDCNMTLSTSTYPYHTRANKYKNNSANLIINNELAMRRSDFNGRIEVYSYINKKEEIMLPQELFNEAQDIVSNQLKECLMKHTTLKFNMKLICEYMKLVDENINLAPIVHISKMMLGTVSDDIVECYRKYAEDISGKMDEFQERDSGWTLLSIRSLEISGHKCIIIKGSQYITLPKCIAHKCACINVENRDEYCCKWCLIVALYTKTELNSRQRKKFNLYDIGSIHSEVIILGQLVLNFRSIQFPVRLKQIKKFEQQNSISIIVFGYSGESIVRPYYITTEENAVHLNLLLLTYDDRSHYVLISDISKFLRPSITSHKSKIYVCNSLYHSHTDNAFKSNKNVCGWRTATMPQAENAYITLKNYRKQLDVPFGNYADFESILEKMDQGVSTNTSNIQKHIYCAFSYYIKCGFSKENDSHRYYLEADAAKMFTYKLVTQKLFIRII